MESNLPLDNATLSLILQLQIQDIEWLLKLQNGETREGEVSDEYLALATYHKELGLRCNTLSDRTMAQSLAHAVASDAILVNQYRTEEEVAATDRDLARRLEGNDMGAGYDQQPLSDTVLDEGFIDRLRRLYVGTPKGEGEKSEQECAEPSGTSIHAECSASRRRCIACDGDILAFETFRASCGHIYCTDCLETLFHLSTTDESLFPPRCCHRGISLQSVKTYIAPETCKLFEKKSIEFLTPDRTYCCRPSCSAFISQKAITSEQATCVECSSITCTVCKAPAHDGDCPEDIAMQEVLQLAQQQGWQRCYSCRRIIELNFGCNHITYALPFQLCSQADLKYSCKCGVQFWYQSTFEPSFRVTDRC